MEYIATFYSHFGAVRFLKSCQKDGVTAKMMPVPRNLSSSCGSCVRFEKDGFCVGENVPEEVEQIVEVTSEGYQQIYRAQNS